MTAFNYLLLVAEHTRKKLWILNFEQGRVENQYKHQNWSIKSMHFTTITAKLETQITSWLLLRSNQSCPKVGSRDIN